MDETRYYRPCGAHDGYHARYDPTCSYCIGKTIAELVVTVDSLEKKVKKLTDG